MPDDEEEEDAKKEDPSTVRLSRDVKLISTGSKTVLFQGDDAGLEVTQIVITAATPMSEEHKTFPAGDSGKEQAKSKSASAPAPTEEPSEPEEPSQDFEAFADFTQLDSPKEQDEDDSKHATGDFDDTAFPPESPLDPQEVSDVKLIKVGEGEIEAEIEGLKSVLEPKKASLDIEDDSSRLSRGESGESPVTPEELDVHNLARLESLKESDA